MELDETIEDGLIREIHEETGVTVKPERLTGVYKNMQRGIVALVFRCTPTDGSAKRTDEAREIAWLPPTEISERMDPAYAIRVLDALDDLRPAVRAHDGHELH